MKNLTKAVALSAIIGGAVVATPAQAWWGGPGWGGWPGSHSNVMDDWMDGTGWGDMTFSTSMGGRGYGRGYNRGYNYGYPYYGGPWGYAPYYGGHAPYYGAPWAYAPAPWGHAAPQADSDANK